MAVGSAVLIRSGWIPYPAFTKSAEEPAKSASSVQVKTSHVEETRVCPEAPGRYSPSQCIGIQKTSIIGNPDAKHVSTSYVERQNLTMRMGMRRFTRLTNGFSKKTENHEAAIALHFMYYNLARIHQMLRITPAMAAGVSDHVWEVEDIVALLDAGKSN